MVVALPFWKGDVEEMARLITWIRDLTGASEHRSLLVADASVSWPDAARIVKLSEQTFGATHLIVREPSVIGWPEGPNELFATAADYCKEPWLWMETDAVPLHRDWISLLESEYKAMPAHAAFLAATYSGGSPDLPARMMSGIAVYPPNTGQWLRDAQLKPGEAFDVGLSRFAGSVISRIHHTNRIHQHLGPNRVNSPTFKEKRTPQDEPRVFTLASLKPNALIFHRNKDGTLINLLREKMNIKIPVVPKRPEVIIRRTAALGDSLAATVVAKKMDLLGYDVVFQSHPSCHCVLRRVPWIARVEDCIGTPHANLDGAYERNTDRRNLHFARMFVDRANEQLHGAIANAHNFAPQMHYVEDDRVYAESILSRYPKPWTMICPRSHAWANRTVLDSVWREAAKHIKGTTFWIGLNPAPQGIVDLQCRHFDRVIQFIGAADLLVTVDTGPMHVAAALATPVIAIQQASSPELHLSDQQDWEMISPPLGCLNCQDDVCRIHATEPPCQRISPRLIYEAANRKLDIATTEGVSVCMAVYKPRVEKLNRALSAVLPQVQEIVVVSDSAGHIPEGALRDGKIRYVKMKARDVGYGRKQNYGMRHTNNALVLQLNDDCYLEPDCVAKLKQTMRPGVGAVTHLLWYPTNPRTVQHGGKIRAVGETGGWGHVSHRQTHSHFTDVVEQETLCGASVLLRRKAFYQAQGFDEDFHLYCEDDDLGLKLREAGWKILFTPHAEGIHDEHSSTSITQNMHVHLQNSCRLFGQKWSWYLQKNKFVVPGTFD